MQQKAGDDKDARPDLQFGTRVRLAALRFVVAFGSRHFVGDGKPNRQGNVEQKCTQQDDFKHFDDVVGTHEVTESVVPSAAVVSQDTQIRRGMEQQEDA